MKTELLIVREKIADLRDNKGIRTPIKCSFTWTPKDGDKTVYESFPSKESIKAAALDVRHFLIKTKAPLNMGNLVKQLRLNDKLDQARLNEFYNTWKRVVDEQRTGNGPFGWYININDQHLSIGKQIDLWMNGVLFHTDSAKRSELESIIFSDIRDKTWVGFVETIRTLVKLLLYFDQQFLIETRKSD